MPFRSHVTRSLDPRAPSNVAISGLTLLVAAVAGVLALTGDRTLWLPVLAAGATFLTWALGRELDPDHQATALVAAVPTAVVVLLGYDASFLVILTAVLASRLLVGTTGRRPLPTDLFGLVVLAGLVSFTLLGWLFAFGLAVAIYLDDRRADAQTGAALAAALGAAVTATVVATLTDAMPDVVPSPEPLLTAAAGLLALVAVLRDPVAPMSLVDSRRKSMLDPQRLHLGRSVIALLIFVGTLLDPGEAALLGTMSLTLALALGADEVERINRARRPTPGPG